MRPFTFSLFAALTIVLCACSAPQGRPASDSARGEIQIVVLADLVANADQNALLVRFVKLTPSDLDRLRTSCGSRFEIFSADKAEESADVLRLRGTNREGVHLSSSVIKIHGEEAEASGSYVHPHSFSSFIYKLHFDGEAWKIVSCEFSMAS
jgi:hypothetical protein